MECLEVENAFTHTWMAYLPFHNFRFLQCYLVAEGAFWAEVPPILVEMRRFLCTSSESANSLVYHFGMEGSLPYDFCKQLPDVIPSQPLPFDAQEIQFLES
jgi:hypothetical protein